jgi:hypothetical protein
MGMRARALRLRNHYHNRNHGHIQVRIEGLLPRLLIRGSDSVPLSLVPFLAGNFVVYFSVSCLILPPFCAVEENRTWTLMILTTDRISLDG